MGLVHPDSLAETADAVGDALFRGRPIALAERRRAAHWIAARQGQPGAYAGMFAPTRRDFERGIRLFTGERVATRAGTAHVLGEEACRALILLNVTAPEVRRALEAASGSMSARLQASRRREVDAGRPFLGQYCCGTCTAALWRHLAAGGLGQSDPEAWLAAGLAALKDLRDGRGRWGRFPFHYTCLALAEIGLPAAVEERRYAAPVLERLLKRAPRTDRLDARRRAVAERVLAAC